MLEQLDLGNVLFLDIETVPQYPKYDDMDDRFKALWDKKAMRIKREEEETPVTLYPRAGIYAEFGKIVCISVGFFNGAEFRVSSFYGKDEEKILRDFANMLNKFYDEPQFLLCAHNGKEFDFPYIARRMIVNKVHLPKLLNIAGKKPWEIQHLDTMELWKFGDFKNYTSLELLTALFGIPTPKDDINGADVWKVYWLDDDVERIKVYCQKDVISLAQLLKAYRLEPLLTDDQIVYV